MNIITIPETLKARPDQYVLEQLNRYTFNFLTQTDLTNAEQVKQRLAEVELYLVETLIRIAKYKNGAEPMQNKLYDVVQKIFNEVDAYNINRFLSGVRRYQLTPLVADNKYMHWFKNRAKYAQKALGDKMQAVAYTMEEVPW